jgi:flagellar motor protein MotB
MRYWACSLALGVLAAAGCAENPYVLQTQNQSLQQAQVALQQRVQELQSRATTLDQDNQEMQSLLAQARQQGKLVEDQLVAVREQLAGASTQLAQLREEKQLTEQQAEALAASTRRRGGAIITANSSLRKSLPGVNIPGIEVREDGDVVRIELPAARLFQPGTAAPQSSAGILLENVAAELARVYPDQIIGVEGHTESDPVRGTQGGDNQQLSVDRAMAVYQQLIARGKLQPSQLFTAGHAGNHPVVSNATPAGKARNNRVELVVYPEKRGGQ